MSLHVYFLSKIKHFYILYLLQLEICQKYGLGQNDLILVNSTYPVLLVNEFIKKLRQMGINDKELLAEIRPYLGFSKDALQRYYDYVEKIRTLSSLM